MGSISKFSKFFQPFILYNSLCFFSVTLLVMYFIHLVSFSDFYSSYVLSYISINVGLRGIFAGIFNLLPVFADEIADVYNWKEGSSAQRDVAANDFAFGIVGVLSIFCDWSFRCAVLIGYGISTLLTEGIGICKITFSFIRKSDYVFPVELFVGMVIDIFSIVLLIACFERGVMYGN